MRDYDFCFFFPKDSYLGVLRLFLRVLEVARSRRLGIAGEVSVWQIPENSVNHARVNTAATFWSARFWSARFWSARFWSATFWTGVFLIGKTIIGRFSNKKLLEHRPMIVFPIRSCARPNSCAERKNFLGKNFLGKNLGGRDPARVFATQRSQIRGDWILSTQRLPIHWSLRGSNPWPWAHKTHALTN